MNRADFARRLSSLINASGLESTSDTPDMVLAEFLSVCLTAFDDATQRRERFYGRPCGDGRSFENVIILRSDPLGRILHHCESAMPQDVAAVRERLLPVNEEQSVRDFLQMLRTNCNETPVGKNFGHGHVWKRPDGAVVRCGGPRICKECTLDAARFLKKVFHEPSFPVLAERADQAAREIYSERPGFMPVAAISLGWLAGYDARKNEEKA